MSPDWRAFWCSLIIGQFVIKVGVVLMILQLLIGFRAHDDVPVPQIQRNWDETNVTGYIQSESLASTRSYSLLGSAVPRYLDDNSSSLGALTTKTVNISPEDDLP
ncbi:hypothetical protein V8C43DRAFT_306900 [Trichoderma afarasin]